jgi:riboflavin kinase/FMN adenylyltransferase
MEVHLFDFSGELYGELLNVELIAYLREEKTFPSLDALKVQMMADAKEARRVLAAAAEAVLDR